MPFLVIMDHHADKDNETYENEGHYNNDDVDPVHFFHRYESPLSQSYERILMNETYAIYIVLYTKYHYYMNAPYLVIMLCENEIMMKLENRSHFDDLTKMDIYSQMTF